MKPQLILNQSLANWIAQFPLIQSLTDYAETSWFNPAIKTNIEGLSHVGLNKLDIDEAAARLERFAPLIQVLFPETAVSKGIIESPLVPISHMQAYLDKNLKKDLSLNISGKLLLKQDSELPISGSIKARGGIYEVLFHAERLALEAKLLKESDNYAILASAPFKTFFAQHSIAVGSTGNLGLSIGIMSAKLGFKAIVHMSTEARQWKKDKLREQGVTVVEHISDYSAAVAAGRAEAAQDPNCHFIDDENSTRLFLGYAVAARRLRQQLEAMHIVVDAEHPLFVYLPCGVGGGPGGVAFGLKTEFTDHVHCIFAEPTHSPAMFLGVYTGKHDEISVQDFGIDNVTIADGLACGRPSGFVGKAMQYLIDGYYTVSDHHLSQLLYALEQQEGIFIEPSSAASLAGIPHALRDVSYLERMGLTPQKLSQATHIAWATGGSMVPQLDKESYIQQGKVSRTL